MKAQNNSKENILKAIILAGGKGTRLQSVVANQPKPLAPVQGEAFIFILIRFLVFHKIDQIVISTGHLAENFEKSLEDLRLIEQSISLVRESHSLGTGGATRFACENFNRDEFILVVNGDTFFDFNLSSFIECHKNHNALALKYVEDASRYGTVDLKNNLLTHFIEKENIKKPGVIYAGFGIFKVEDILGRLPEGKSSLELDLFLNLLSNKLLYGQIYDGDFIDIGIPEDYKIANTTFNFTKFLNHF